MTQTMTNETQPTSEWEHSHALNDGDELEHESEGRGEVLAVHDNGEVTVSWGDYRRRHTEDEIRRPLANDDMKRVSDGKSHELASF